MIPNIVEPLEWDSQFFNYPVAQIVVNHQGFGLLNVLFRELALKKIHLTYIFVPASEEELNKEISNRGCLLVDQKTVFSKRTQKHSKFSNRIIDYQGTEINESLIKVVLQAGEFSRFRTDTSFSNNEYKRLYVEWVKKSVSGELSKKVFVAVINSEIAGITTLGEKDGNAAIGLVAVDKNLRGKGIGYDLIHKADNFAFNLKHNEIKVVTQLHNKAACKLYKKCNFSIESITNVYHFWQ